MDEEVKVREDDNVIEPDPLEVRFEKFQGDVSNALGLIADQLGKLNEQKTPVPKVEDEAGPDQDTPVPLNWRKAVTEILGLDFDCELKQPDRGGTIFTIIVPKNKSNASQLHWQNFRQDKRSKELGNTGLEGVKEWCKKVRANLLATGAKLVQYP